MKAVLEMNSPKTTVEEIYLLIKACVKTGYFFEEHLEGIIEMTTELLGRMKEGEFSGEQESHRS